MANEEPCIMLLAAFQILALCFSRAQQFFHPALDLHRVLDSATSRDSSTTARGKKGTQFFRQHPCGAPMRTGNFQSYWPGNFVLRPGPVLRVGMYFRMIVLAKDLDR